jgi:nicotinamide-nucleotide amidase
LKAEIFSIGTELLMGELTDTNAAWIAAKLPALGIQLQWVSIVGDNLEMLTDAFTLGMQRSDIIFTTGGLGPTQDDLTREGVAKALGETPTVQEEVVRQLEQYFQGRGQTMPAPNIKQAHLIPSARFITNRNGTAPGWWSERNGKIIINMPGPPAEMHPIWESEVAPRLREIVEDEVTITRNIKTLGLSEAAVDEIVSEYFGKENPYLGIYSKADGIHLRIIARARNEDQARGMIAPVENAIETRLGQYIWGYDDETPEMAVGQVLTERGLTLSTMESSTGGFLANSITESPDSYVYFKGGVVAYSDDMKTSCGVPPETIREHGSVSQETANAMARAIRERMGSDFGIGIAGAVDPSDLGGRRPGQVYLAIASADEVREFDLRVPPRRITIKRRASNTVLTELRKMINTGVGVR